MKKLRVWTWAFTKWYYYLIAVILFWINYNNNPGIMVEDFPLIFGIILFSTYFWFTLLRWIYLLGYASGQESLTLN